MTLNPDVDRIDLYHKIQDLQVGPEVLNNMGLWSGVDWDSIPENRFVHTFGAFLLKIFVNGIDLDPSFDGLVIKMFQAFPIFLGFPRPAATCCVYANPTKAILSVPPAVQTRPGFIDISELRAFTPALFDPANASLLSNFFISSYFVFYISMDGTLIAPNTDRLAPASAGKKFCGIEAPRVDLGFFAERVVHTHPQSLSLRSPVGRSGLEQVFLSPDDVIPAIKGAFPKSVWS